MRYIDGNKGVVLGMKPSTGKGVPGRDIRVLGRIKG